jgi:penicillin amidase
MMEELTWDELKSSEHELMAPQDFYFLRLIRQYPGNIFFDIKSTPKVENARDIVNMAFIKSADSLLSWKSAKGYDYTWAEYKGTSVQHLLSINAFSKFNISIGGNKHIINACAGRWGPSWKMVVSLGHTPKAWAVYPGGQSGNPGSPYYDNFISTWASGDLYEVKYLTSPDDLINGVLIKQILY